MDLHSKLAYGEALETLDALNAEVQSVVLPPTGGSLSGEELQEALNNIQDRTLLLMMAIKEEVLEGAVDEEE